MKNRRCTSYSCKYKYVFLGKKIKVKFCRWTCWSHEILIFFFGGERWSTKLLVCKLTAAGWLHEIILNAVMIASRQISTIRAVFFKKYVSIHLFSIKLPQYLLSNILPSRGSCAHHPFLHQMACVAKCCREPPGFKGLKKKTSKLQRMHTGGNIYNV